MPEGRIQSVSLGKTQPTKAVTRVASPGVQKTSSAASADEEARNRAAQADGDDDDSDDADTRRDAQASGQAGGQAADANYRFVEDLRTRYTDADGNEQSGIILPGGVRGFTQEQLTRIRDAIRRSGGTPTIRTLSGPSPYEYDDTGGSEARAPVTQAPAQERTVTAVDRTGRAEQTAGQQQAAAAAAYDEARELEARQAITSGGYETVAPDMGVNPNLIAAAQERAAELERERVARIGGQRAGEGEGGEDSSFVNPNLIDQQRERLRAIGLYHADDVAINPSGQVTEGGWLGRYDETDPSKGTWGGTRGVSHYRGGSYELADPGESDFADEYGYAGAPGSVHPRVLSEVSDRDRAVRTTLTQAIEEAKAPAPASDFAGDYGHEYIDPTDRSSPRYNALADFAARQARANNAPEPVWDGKGWKLPGADRYFQEPNPIRATGVLRDNLLSNYMRVDGDGGNFIQRNPGLQMLAQRADSNLKGAEYLLSAFGRVGGTALSPVSAVAEGAAKRHFPHAGSGVHVPEWSRRDYRLFNVPLAGFDVAIPTADNWYERVANIGSAPLSVPHAVYSHLYDPNLSKEEHERRAQQFSEYAQESVGLAATFGAAGVATAPARVVGRQLAFQQAKRQARKEIDDYADSAAARVGREKEFAPWIDDPAARGRVATARARRWIEQGEWPRRNTSGGVSSEYGAAARTSTGGFDFTEDAVDVSHIVGEYGVGWETPAALALGTAPGAPGVASSAIRRGEARLDDWIDRRALDGYASASANAVSSQNELSSSDLRAIRDSLDQAAEAEGVTGEQPANRAERRQLEQDLARQQRRDERAGRRHDTEWAASEGGILYPSEGEGGSGFDRLVGAARPVVAAGAVLSAPAMAGGIVTAQQQAAATQEQTAEVRDVSSFDAFGESAGNAGVEAEREIDIFADAQGGGAQADATTSETEQRTSVVAAEDDGAEADTSAEAGDIFADATRDAAAGTDRGAAVAEQQQIAEQQNVAESQAAVAAQQSLSQSDAAVVAEKEQLRGQLEAVERQTQTDTTQAQPVAQTTEAALGDGQTQTDLVSGVGEAQPGLADLDSNVTTEQSDAVGAAFADEQAETERPADAAVEAADEQADEQTAAEEQQQAEQQEQQQQQDQALGVSDTFAGVGEEQSHTQAHTPWPDDEVEKLNPIKGKPKPPGGFPRLVAHEERVKYTLDPDTGEVSQKLTGISEPAITEWDRTPPTQEQRGVSRWEVTPYDNRVDARPNMDEAEIAPEVRAELERQAANADGLVEVEATLRVDHDLDSEDTRTKIRSSQARDASGDNAEDVLSVGDAVAPAEDVMGVGDNSSAGDVDVLGDITDDMFGGGKDAVSSGADKYSSLTDALANGKSAVAAGASGAGAANYAMLAAQLGQQQQQQGRRVRRGGRRYDKDDDKNFSLPQIIIEQDEAAPVRPRSPSLRKSPMSV